jgi:hypothetical protein
VTAGPPSVALWRTLRPGDGDQDGGVGAELLAVDGDDDDETATRERRRLSELLATDWAFTFPFRSIEEIRADLYS